MLGFKRIVAALALSCGVVWLSSAPVLGAGGSGRDLLPAPPDVTVSCPQGFSVIVHVGVDKEYIKSHTWADGTDRFQINGNVVATVTGNGQTIVINASGPATVFVRPDGSVTVVGRGLGYVSGPGLIGIWLYSGHTELDPFTGQVTSHRGSVRDLCAELA